MQKSPTDRPESKDDLTKISDEETGVIVTASYANNEDIESMTEQAAHRFVTKNIDRQVSQAVRAAFKRQGNDDMGLSHAERSSLEHKKHLIAEQAAKDAIQAEIGRDIDKAVRWLFGNDLRSNGRLDSAEKRGLMVETERIAEIAGRRACRSQAEFDTLVKDAVEIAMPRHSHNGSLRPSERIDLLEEARQAA